MPLDRYSFDPLAEAGKAETYAEASHDQRIRDSWRTLAAVYRRLAKDAEQDSLALKECMKVEESADVQKRTKPQQRSEDQRST
jgi:hypothetical protein